MFWNKGASEMSKRIITISREFGSGGRFIGEEVAKKLGMAYYDKNVITEIAEKSGLSPEYIQENAELSPKKGVLPSAPSSKYPAMVVVPISNAARHLRPASFLISRIRRLL